MAATRSVGRKGNSYAHKLIIYAAASAALAVGRAADAGGDFDGGEVSAIQTRLWGLPINWNFDILPTPADALTFSLCGDGTIDLGGIAHAHPNATFDNWVTYTMAGAPGSSLTLTMAGGTFIKVSASVGATYGSEYFADGTNIASGFSSTTPLMIDFSDLTSGSLRIGGTMTGAAPMTLVRSAAGATNIRPVYFDMPSPGRGGSTTIMTGTAARLLGAGRTGFGVVTLQGGSFEILSEPAQAVGNTISSAIGTVRADHNYTAVPMPPFAPGTVHTLGPIFVDNPTFVGGTPAASITFTANNGYNFSSPMLTLANVVAAPGATRTVTVENGVRTGGYAGAVRQTGPNNLNDLQVTTTIGPAGGAAPVLFDANPATPGFGFVLNKTGGGVLTINGDNQTSSTGAKLITGGVIRFGSAVSYGTTTGVAFGPPVAVTLGGGPGPVSAGMGRAYVGAGPGIPANLVTTGATAGQSGVFDIDTPGFGLGVVLPTINTAGMATGWRLGSSGVGAKVAGGFIPYTSPVGVNTYYLGGGGGALTLGAVMMPGPGPGPTNIEMGTSGTLRPGLVTLGPGAVAIGPPGFVNIRAGTLQAPPGVAFPWPATAGTSVGAYSTALTTGSAYAVAPAATPFNGPGQFLLDPALVAAYVYGPFGSFGAAGMMHDGGAVGFTGGVVLPGMPAPPGGAGLFGTWGAPLASSLYTTVSAPGAPIATNIFHLGGEASAGVMSVPFLVTNNPGPDLILGTPDDIPVALLKSGLGSVLDLTLCPGVFASGGIGIMGGEVWVNGPPQLGLPGPTPTVGPVVITDGGILHIVPGGPPMPVFPQLLRVANGPSARASVVDVDGGIIANFSGALSPSGVSLEADTIGSVLQKTGPGVLQIYPPAILPAPELTAANTWGIRATAGLVSINQMPGIFSPSNGQALFDGGVMELVGPASPMGFVPIPAFVQGSPNYGFGALSSYAGTASSLIIGDGAFFRLTGGQQGDWMGAVSVSMGPMSVFKVAGNPAGGNTRGTGTMTFFGGNVQFTPGGGNILLPRDGGFTLSLNAGVTFSGCPDADLHGNLLFNEFGAGPVTIDAATVPTAALPVPAASTWTISGTGLTSWNGTVNKGSTFGLPGGGGPSTGNIVFDRCAGAPVTVTAGSLFVINAGAVSAGNTGDPYTQNVGPVVYLNVENNSAGPGVGVPPLRGFNITAGNKQVGNLTVTGFAPAAPALGVSSTSVFTGSSLTANYVRQSNVDINGTGSIVIRTDPGAGTCSRVNTLNIAGGIGAWTAKLDMNNNDMIIDYAGASPLATVFNQIATAYAGGPWTGNGITSASAAATSGALNKTALGYGENSSPALGLAMFDGQAVDLTSIIIRYTYFGDANLDGLVNTIDFNILAANFSLAGTTWTRADFNYDAVTNTIDFNLLASNFGLALPASAASPAIGGVVPEPSLALVATVAAAAGTLLRRRRCRRS